MCKYPIERGIITNWDDMEKIWHHAFYEELRVQPEDHPVFLTETPLNPKASREKMTQVMFETFNVPAFYISNQAVLSLSASGCTTGLALTSGDVTFAVPVYEGFSLPHATLQSDISGPELTEYLAWNEATHLHLRWNARWFETLRRNFAMSPWSSRRNFRWLKVVWIWKGAMSCLTDRSSTLAANGTSFSSLVKRALTYSCSRFRVPEALFQPSLLRLEAQGVHEIMQVFVCMQYSCR